MKSKNTRIFVAGHEGMVGASIVRALRSQGYNELLLRKRAELDLARQSDTETFFSEERPEVAVIAAAKVGGIHANNTYPADFIAVNLAIALNCVQAAWHAGVKRLLFLGSSCIYPKHAPQPMPESSLLTGALEPTNEAYAIAKIAGLKLCEFYRRQHGVLFHSAMPTNLYGPGDNYHPENSHVLPGMLHKFHRAKVDGCAEVVLWGSGAPRREFLHVDDLASGILHLLRMDDPPDWVNLGYGEDVTIRELAEVVREAVGFEGDIRWDTTRPDGTPRKLMDNRLMFGTGWKPAISLADGVRDAYADYLQRLNDGTLRTV